MNYLKLSVLCVVVTMATGCSSQRAIEREAQQPLAEVKRFRHSESGREVIFVPMRHIGAQKRYEVTRQYLDTMKRQGWVVFHEGVVAVPYHVDTINDIPIATLDTLGQNLTQADRPRIDTMMRKCRRMLGYMVSNRGYADTTNLSLKSDISLRKRYISQSRELLGATSDQDIWCDYSLHDIIEVCEKRFGKIPLTDYDFETDLYDKYEQPTKLDPRMRSYFTIFARNDYVIRRIMESNHKRIVVVYGSAHSFGIFWQLKSKLRFKRVRDYNADENAPM